MKFKQSVELTESRSITFYVEGAAEGIDKKYNDHGPTVNWSALGSVELPQAIAFVKYLQKAIDTAKSLKPGQRENLNFSI
jgi:hypothetical protein